jgi:cytochrome b561
MNLVRYDRMAIGLHWGMALALVALFGVGLYMTGLPFSPQRLKLYNWHKWAGMVVLGLSLWRLLWRLTHPAPALPAMPVWQRRVSQQAHVALYVLFLVVPLLGWAYSSAAGFTVVLWGVWALPDWVPANPALAEVLKPWHGWAANTLAVLVVLHVLAALKHHYVDRDGLLFRMSWRSR